VSTEPDRILDIRARVPHGVSVKAVMGSGRPDGIIDHALAIEGIYDMTPHAPKIEGQFTIEVGKTYRTRSGLTAGIAAIRDDDRAIEGWVDFDKGRSRVCWWPDGSISPGRDDPLDLIPVEIDEPEAEPLTPTDQRIQLLFDGLARVEQRLAKMAEEQAADVRQAHNRMTRLSAIIDGVDKAREVLRKDMDERFTKRTIKGGWLNMYPDGNHFPHPDRASADKASLTAASDRIACIQIPDVTEGEGL